MKRRLSTILFGVVFIAGLSLLLYPTVSDYWNSFHQSRAIASYVDAVDNTDEQKLDEMRKAAQAYNEKLLSKQDRYEMSDQDKAEYESLLDVARCPLNFVLIFLYSINNLFFLTIHRFLLLPLQSPPLFTYVINTVRFIYHVNFIELISFVYRIIFLNNLFN